jgi:hypothetical protein
VINGFLALALLWCLFLFLDERSRARDERQHRERVEREIDALERRESGEC